MSNSTEQHQSDRKSPKRRKRTSRLTNTVIEASVMPQVAEALKKRIAQTLTYKQLKADYGCVISEAIDAGVSVDEFVELYSDHLNQLNRRNITASELEGLKAVYFELRSEQTHKKIGNRKPSAPKDGKGGSNVVQHAIEAKKPPSTSITPTQQAKPVPPELDDEGDDFDRMGAIFAQQKAERELSLRSGASSLPSSEDQYSRNEPVVTRPVL